MTDYVLSEATRQNMRPSARATLCTALFKRGLRNQFIQDVRPLSPKTKNMVGQAFTLRYIPAREDLNQLAVFRNPEHPQRAAVEQCPPGSVLVMDSRKDAARRLGRLDPGLAADGARRRRRRHRWRLPRQPGDRRTRYSRLSQPPVGADQPDAASGDRHQRADRLRRRRRLARRRDRRRPRRRHRHPRPPRRRDRRRGGRDDGLRGFRHRRGAERRSIIGLYPATKEETKADFAQWRQVKGR